MRYITSIITICLALVALSSCNGDKQFEQRLEAMDSLMRELPDSAYHVLLGMRSEACHQGKQQRMHYELSLADAQNKAYVDFVTDSVMKTVADYYDDHGTPNQQMRAYYLLGCTYRDMKDVPMELQYFQKATEVADTTDKDCDLYTLSAIYGQMADIYHQQFLPHEELKSLVACEKLDMQRKDTLMSILSYALRIRVYQSLSDNDSIIHISENARRMFLEHGDSTHAAIALCTAITKLIDTEQYSKAAQYMEIYEKESGYFAGDSCVNELAHIYSYDKGRFYLYKGENSLALRHFNLLLKYGFKEAAYSGLVSFYEKNHNADSLAKYAKLFTEANDAGYRGKSTEIVQRMSAMYNYGHILSVSEKIASNYARSLRLVIVVMLISIVLIIVIYVGSTIYKIERRKAVNRINLLTQNLEIATILYNKLCQERDEETHKFQSLVASNKIIGDELRIMKENHEQNMQLKEDEIRTLKSSLENISHELRNARLGIIQESFYESDIYRLFKNVGENGQHEITLEEWDSLNQRFNRYFSPFCESLLSNKALTTDQFRVAMLIKLGFKESDIANIMDKSSSRINKIKMQVNTKLFGKPDAKSLRENINKGI